MKSLFKNFLTLLFILAFVFAVYSFFYPQLMYTLIPKLFGPDHHFYKMMQYSWDKQGHFLYLGACAFLLNYLFKSKKVNIKSITFLLGNLILVVLTSIEELRQHFVPNRNFDLLDLLAGFAGIFVFGFMGAWLYRFLSVEKRAMPLS